MKDIFAIFDENEEEQTLDFKTLQLTTLAESEVAREISSIVRAFIFNHQCYFKDTTRSNPYPDIKEEFNRKEVIRQMGNNIKANGITDCLLIDRAVKR